MKIFMKISNLVKVVFFISMICFALVGCQQNKDLIEIENTTAKSINGAILKQESQRALSLITLYFGGELTVQDLVRGPAGTIQILTKDNSTSALKTLYMLPDQQHLIEGVLYSPHMTSKEITELHSQVTYSRATMNENLKAEKDEMRQKISTAISQKDNDDEDIKKLTEEAIMQRVQNSSAAKRKHNENIVDSMLPDYSLPETASLPRNNTVVDKQSLYKKIQTSNWISSGDNSKILYVFYDFRCPACADVHTHLDEYVKNDAVQVRYIPVGALGPESLVRASLSLIPKNNETRLKLMSELAKPEPIETLLTVAPSQEELQEGHRATMQNFKLLMDTQRIATPTFAYQTSEGPQIAILTSKQQLDEVIQNIVGS